MRVIWTPEALQDRIDIWDYIAAESPQAAARMDERFSQAVSPLTDHPRIGRQGMVPGTLELIPHEHYRLVYEIDGDTAWILALVHTSRQWPPVHK
ncbi:MAG: type II toxin-antitoxin system RelE/ParE family toxin [Gammaproteobacteria bacterium]|nr:type II toxin-antitoxin system RelE/ParE family toxin [Gammaproteobacteria bacterium]MCP5414431.1 type II toxin-antitoxin system RelE/ParE family toxin [Chromatiaceae bacterium]MCP5437186.1 type II toxin-antitoxin system RelE/ParE family toxin [Chromatiaceae bacterium]MCP5438329.1 type II toxin-antitoxin system RelE/ParE family toxin [Chromatiaceae bacterium]HOP18303.1 type II toxin-antitoxin system RelE/ParE family toxin [Gammaproteobacteria bacterium]